MPKSDKMVNKRKLDSALLHSKVHDCLYEMLMLDEEINFYSVAKRAGVSRTYLYHHEFFYGFIKQYTMLKERSQSHEALKEGYESAQKELANAHKKYVETLQKYKAMGLDK